MPRLRQYQEVFSPVVFRSPSGPAGFSPLFVGSDTRRHNRNRASDTFLYFTSPFIAQPAATFPLPGWEPPKRAQQNRTAIQSSGSLLGGDWSVTLGLIELNQPRPRRPGISVAEQQFNTVTIGNFVGPANTLAEWYRDLDRKSPKRPGIGSANQQFFIGTVTLIPVPPATMAEWYQPLATPRPHRPGLPVAEQQFFFASPPNTLPTVPTTPSDWMQAHRYRPGLRAANQQFATHTPAPIVGPPATTATWMQPLSTRQHRLRQGPSPAEMPFTFAVPPYVPPTPPPSGGTQRRRRFVRRGRVY